MEGKLSAWHMVWLAPAAFFMILGMINFSVWMDTWQQPIVLQERQAIHKRPVEPVPPLNLLSEIPRRALPDDARLIEDLQSKEAKELMACMFFSGLENFHAGCGLDPTAPGDVYVVVQDVGADPDQPVIIHARRVDLFIVDDQKMPEIAAR